MNLVILIAGVAGLAVAAYGLVALVARAWRRRRYADIAAAVLVAAATIALLLAFGDRIVR